MPIAQDRLHELFEYKDGRLYRKKRMSQNTRVGDLVGSIGNHGYLTVCIKNTRYLVHRLVFAMHHGYMPKNVDHIDGDRTNNRIENLREASDSENLCNSRVRSDNKSGLKNLCWNERRKCWIVSVTAQGKRIYKYIKDLELAELCATMAREKFHGQFANHGGAICR